MSKSIAVFLGVAALATAAFLLGRATQAKPAARETGRATIDPELLRVTQELEDERALVAELRKEKAELVARIPPPPVPEAKPEEREEARGEMGAADRGAPAGAPVPPTEQELKAAVDAFGAKLQSIIVGQEDGSQAAEALRAVLARATKEQMARLIGEFAGDNTSVSERYLYAHVLAQSGWPEALEVLKQALRDPDSDLVLQRTAAHGLAFSDAEGVKEFTLQIARTTPERGVRANLAFGLARRGVDEGVDLYFAATDEAFAEKDSVAVQYLSGFFLMDNPKAAKGVRDRLLTYQDEQALIVLIEIVRRKGDKEAIPNLEKLAFDKSRPASVQKAAQGAIELLNKP